MAKKQINTENNNIVTLWKFIGIFVLVFVAIRVAVSFFDYGVDTLIRWVNAGENLHAFLGSILSNGGKIAITILITVPVLRKVLKKKSRAILYPFVKGWNHDFAYGSLLSTAALSMIFIIEFVIGWLQINGFILAGEPMLVWFRKIWLAILINLSAAVSTEVLFRGLLLTGLKESWDERGAIFVSSIIFAATHLVMSGSSQTDWLTFVPMFALPGVMLGWAYLRTGNLWLSTGVHFAWIFFQDDIFNLIGTPSNSNQIGLATTMNGPEWFVGNSYGFEVGLAGILAAVLVIAGIWIVTKKRSI